MFSILCSHCPFSIPCSPFSILYSPFSILYSQFSIPDFPPCLLFTEFINPKSNLKMESSSIITESHTPISINPKFLDNNNKVSNSLADPSEMYKNCISSFSDLLAHPSAIFAGIDTAHLLNCETSPNFSSVGKDFVRTYITFTSSKLFFQASSFWCGFMPFNFPKSMKLVKNNQRLTVLSSTAPILKLQFPIYHSPLTIPH